MEAKPRTVLSAALDAWALEATVASRYLSALYRAMGDGAQAAAALRAGQPAVERVERSGIQADLLPLQAAFRRAHPDEILAEEAAWRGLITSLGGISVFLSMVEGGTSVVERGLRGMQHAFARALETAQRGYRAGFPESMTNPGTLLALGEAARFCAEIFIGDHGEDPRRRAALVRECERTILEGLQATLGGAPP